MIAINKYNFIYNLQIDLFTTTTNKRIQFYGYI